MRVKLIDIYDKFVEHKLKRVKPATISNLQKVKNKFILYEQRHGELDLSDLSLKWFEKFVSFMLSHKGGKITNKTVELYTTVLFGFLRDVQLNGYAVNEDYKLFKRHIAGLKKNQTVRTILSEDEVLDLWHCLDLTRMQHYVKDLFIYQINTGLRWGDICRIKRGHIAFEDGEFYLVDFITQKTGSKITIHLNEICMYIINRYCKGFDKILSSTCVFRNVPSSSNATNKLKQVAKYANLNRKVQDIVGRGDKEIIRTRELHKVISTHCGRHTFASNYMNEVGNIYKLKELLGHKSIQTTERYVKTLPGFIPRDIVIQLSPKKKELYKIA